MTWVENLRMIFGKIIELSLDKKKPAMDAASYDGLLKTWDDLSWIGARPWGYLRCQGVSAGAGGSPPPLPQGYIITFYLLNPSLSKPLLVGGPSHPPPPSATRGRGSDLLLPPSRGGPQGVPSPAHSSLLSTGSSLRWVFPSLGPPFTGSFFPLLRRPCGASSLCWVFPSIDLSFTGSSLQWIFP